MTEPMVLPEPPPLEIAPEELAALRAAGAGHAIVDVREAWEVAICGFPEALHVPLGELAQRVDELPAEGPLVVVCHTGRRSLLATRYLRQAGRGRATNLQGGVEAWALSIDPRMARY